MISKNKIKFIASLSQKKCRDEHNMFVAEGTKLVLDLMLTFNCNQLVASTEWLCEHPVSDVCEVVEVTADELKRISNQKTPQGVLAVFSKKESEWDVNALAGKLSLALDEIQDPGNLGTILRVADWFGISDVFCSENTADAFSPKAVQATMGALARVNVHVLDMPRFIDECSRKMPVYGTFMDGESIYSRTLKPNGIIVMGNEGNGISDDVEKYVSDRLLIPNFPVGQLTSESLNVGVATALVCAEFRRRIV
jgi:TrmH family RNA methyltransferase